MLEPMDNTNSKPQGLPETDRKISCDQVAWMLNAIDRVMAKSVQPSVSRQTEMKKLACLYEIMESASLSFKDDSARWNATPKDVRKY